MSNTNRYRLLHINPIKNCCVSPNQGICKNFTEQEISQYCCTSCNNNGMPAGAYTGRNLGFKYTPESNCDWKWTRCDGDAKNCEGKTPKNVGNLFLGNKSNFDCLKVDRKTGVF